MPTYSDSGWATDASGAGWTNPLEATGTSDDTVATAAPGAGVPQTDPLTVGPFGVLLPSWPGTTLVAADTTATFTARCNFVYTGSAGLTDFNITATLKLRGGALSAEIVSGPHEITGSLADFEIAFDLTHASLVGQDVTADELAAAELELVLGVHDPEEVFEVADEIGAEVDSVELDIELEGAEIDYLPDPPYGTKRIIPYIAMQDGDGLSPGGLHPDFVSDPVAFIETRFADPEAAGFKVRSYFWCFGQATFDRGVTAGVYPEDYPGSPMYPVQASPVDQEMCESEALTPTMDLESVQLALQSYYAVEAAANGTRYRPCLYFGPRWAGHDPSGSQLGGVQVGIDLKAHMMIDITGPLDYNHNAASPFIVDPVNDENSILLSWHESDRNVTQAGGAISAWANIAEATVTWGQSTAGNKPALVASQINTYPAIRFDGTSDFMSLAAPLVLGDDWTILMVVKIPSADCMLFGREGFNLQLPRFNEVAGHLSVFDSESTGATRGNDLPAAGTWCIIRIVNDSATSQCRFYVNGAEVDTYAVGPGNVTGAEVDIMGNFLGSAGSHFFNSDLAAVAMYKTSADANLIALMESRWSVKYGIALTEGEPVLPMRKLWSEILTELEGSGVKLFTEAAERIDLADPTCLGSWLETAQAFNMAGGAIASSNYHLPSYDPENSSTWGRWEYALAVQEQFQAPEYLHNLANDNEVPLLSVAHFSDPGGLDDETILALITRLFNEGADWILVPVSSLTTAGWVEAANVERTANSGAIMQASRRARARRRRRVLERELRKL